VLVLALCRLIDTTKVALAIPFLGVALTAGMLYQSVGHTAPVPGVPVPDSTTALRAELKRLGVKHAASGSMAPSLMPGGGSPERPTPPFLLPCSRRFTRGSIG
jgi:hypothetical protein